MKNLKMLTMLTVCCILAGLTTVSAQGVISQAQLAQKMAHNQNADQTKLDALAAAAANTVSYDAQKVADIQAVVTFEQDCKNLQNQQTTNGGYLPIPGFTPTGDPAVDGPAYETAKTNYKANDPAGFKLFIQLNQN